MEVLAEVYAARQFATAMRSTKQKGQGKGGVSSYENRKYQDIVDIAGTA
jgi:hypothetical protein